MEPQVFKSWRFCGILFSRLCDFIFAFREARVILLRNGQAYGEITGEIQEQ